MQKHQIHNNVNVGDGPVPFLHVVAPEGRGISKMDGFARQPDDFRQFVQQEYNDMRDIATTMLQAGVLQAGDPVVYLAHGGEVAGRAIADAIGGPLIPLMRNADDRNFQVTAEVQARLSHAPRIIVADDVVHTGSALRRSTRAIAEACPGQIIFMASRALNKTMTQMMTGNRGKPGGLIAEFLPEGAQLYTGNIYFGRDNVKISGIVRALRDQGFDMDDLAKAYANRAEGAGAAATTGIECGRPAQGALRGSGSHPRLGPGGSGTGPRAPG